MATLGNNIDTLKNGGNESGLLLRPLSQEYLTYWENVSAKWHDLQDTISSTTNSHSSVAFPSSTTLSSSNNLSQQERQSNYTMTRIENAGTDLITASDVLVSQLSEGSARNSQGLVQLQIILLVLNVAVHSFIFYLIIRIVKPIVSLTSAVKELKKGKFVTVGENDDNIDSNTANSKDEVSLLVNAFNEMVRGLENYDRADKEFFNMAAHELRNPIQPILGMAEVLQKRTESSLAATSSMEEEAALKATLIDQKGLLEVVMRNARKLERLTQEILDVVRIEGGTLSFRKENVDLIDLCKSVVDEYQQAFLASNSKVIKLLIQQQDQNDELNRQQLYVNVDPLRITQVLYNLLNNALKFTDSGGGTIMVKVQRVQALEANVDREEAKVEVIDSGRGIDPEILAHLFGKFVSGSTNGSGLGLFISKRIIENHGGRIWAQNNATDCHGATFAFTLPLVDGRQLDTATRKDIDGEQLQSKSILGT
jgi:signal transduction histidine kinase